ncbi:hypothetical protein FRC98_01515 [Lujinxingia vulgaris]|uniref:Extracellular solute-binding protein n=1 Tax=Lujinxingia vulgaris TaxID=2600176 RepID=A0A5C6XHV1_9DELT|nr:hypothetical protein [Lujinxingia vulgaris]TXD39108.1 hypothetical protein FRC98_01515 [Lujinxingia vulgaris]
MSRFPARSSLYLTMLLTSALMLSACKSTVPDESPVDDAPATSVDLKSLPTHEQLTYLLPADTLVVAAYNIEGFRKLHHQSPLPQNISQSLILDLPLVSEVLSHQGGPEPIEGLDTSRAIYLATSRAGFERAIDGLRTASPELLATTDLGFPDAFHVRALLPVADAETASAQIAQRYQGAYLTTARGDFLVIDFAAGIISPEIQPWSQASPIIEGLAPASSPAWAAFSGRDAPFALYGQMSGLFDQLALIELGSTLLIPRTPAEEARIDAILATEIAATAREFSFDSPEVAESEDLAILLDHHNDVLTLDAVASLTEYGQSLVNAVARSAPMRARQAENVALDVHFGLDLSSAIDQHKTPRWAQDIAGMEEATFKRMIEGQTRDSAWGFPLGVLRSPITGYALFDRFVGEQTTPAEFGLVRGFWMQILGASNEQLVTALGLNLPTDAPREPFEEFARLALTPLGTPVDIKISEHADRLELIASSARPTDDVFAEGQREVAPGVDAFIDLRQIYQILQSVDSVALTPVAIMGLNAIANLGSPRIFAHASFTEAQGIARLQWGGDALIEPPAVSTSHAPTALAPLDACLFTAREWSILGLGEFASLSDPTTQTPILSEELATAIDELATQCHSEEASATVRDLAEDWREFGQR